METVAAHPVGVEARCGRCGYCIRGVSGLTCPECGSDLREVGIRTRRRLGPGVLALLWTLALPVPALFLWAWFYNAAAPRVHTFRQERLIDCYGGAIGKKIRATVEGTQAGWGAAGPAQDIPPRWLVLRLDSPPAAGHPDLVVDLPSRAYSFPRPDGSLASGPSLNADAILEWLEPAGVNRHFPPAIEEAINVVTAVDEIPVAQGKESRYQTDSVRSIVARPTLTRTTSEVPPWVAPAAGGFLLIVWLAGLTVIRSRCR